MLSAVVIVITGPIASGTSTLARALARELEHRGVRVAVIDLDVVHDGLAADGQHSDEVRWMLARHAAASLANTYLDAGVIVVVADGSFHTPSARAEFADDLRGSVGPLYVTLRVSFAEALQRAQRDPTRGVSRDPAYLRPYFAAVDRALAAVPETHVVIDTERTPATSAAQEIARLVRQGSSN